MNPLDTNAPKPRIARLEAAVDPAPDFPHTILVVDDEMLIRNITAALLKRAGATLYLAEDAATAIATFEQHRDSIDVALIDLTLGDMPGQALAQTLRKMQPNLLVTFMSGYSEADLAGERTRFLPKPFRREQLLDCMHELIALDSK